MSESSARVRHGTVLGHGIDIVDIEEFSRLISGLALNYLDRYFTEAEVAASGAGEAQLQKLAGRFAVKEAVLKVLCRGWGDGVAFTDIEVITLESGAPTVTLRRELAEMEQQLSIIGWLVTTSHSAKMAVASVIALSDR